MVTVVSTTPHPSVVREVICGNCGSTLQYVRKDIQERVSTDYSGSKDVDYYITCPPCGNKIFVKRY